MSLGEPGHGPHEPDYEPALRLRAARLRGEVHKSLHGEDMRLRMPEILVQDGIEEYLGRFKRMPVAPTILHARGSAENAECLSRCAPTS